MTIEDRIHELAGIIEVGDPERIIGYLREGKYAAAIELLEQNGHIHAAAMNAGKSETLFGLARDVDVTYGTPGSLDYHSVCERAYASTLVALDTAGLDAEFIDTGGSCKAIAITGTHRNHTHRRFGAVEHIMLTAGGPLSDERDPTCEWEVGLYKLEEYGTEPIAMLVSYPQLTDSPQNDAELAAWLRRIAEVLR